MRHEGACHCGAIRIRFESNRPLAPRACSCSFCRKHGARTVSDPQGAATLECALPPLLYRFASRAADYVLCPRCGVYVGAVSGPPDARIATLNLNAFYDPHLEIEATPVSYDGEAAEEKAERRRLRWTPLRETR
ncbi:MAG TPA: hypothetical protein VD887_13855 [Allosphingosinicella sp.]|nr:hypothetical protein [Allosphingosinicella sp.]